MPAAERKPAVERTRLHLSEPVSPMGTNRIVVAHGPNIAELMDYLPKEGTLILFRPLGQGPFEYLASIPPAHWPELLRQWQTENTLRCKPATVCACCCCYLWSQWCCWQPSLCCCRCTTFGGTSPHPAPPSMPILK